MRETLLKILRAPESMECLTLYTFEREESLQDQEENILEGVLLSNVSRKAYPIVNGVPVLLDSSFTHDFLQKHAEKISRDAILSTLDLSVQDKSPWSFSAEWDQHFSQDLVRTWRWTAGERMLQFLLEANVDPNDCRGKLVLDAGCGNGQLSECLTGLGATVVALDYSHSVFHAEKRRKSSNVHFVRADLQVPPFNIETFDLIISNGVLHHTPDTYKTFVAVAKLVNTGGRFYLWLYRKPEKFFRRYLLLPLFDLIRTVVSRLSSSLQKPVVSGYAFAFYLLHKILGKHKDYAWHERIVDAYDSLTPIWRHYHTPLEVSCWFFQNGYSPPTITHWDNPSGFGMVAAKKPQKDVPGVNFGSTRVVRRYWE